VSTCDQELYGLHSAKAVPRLLLMGLKLAENVTALVMSQSDDHRLTSLTNAIKKEPLCKVRISKVWTISGKNRTI